MEWYADVEAIRQLKARYFRLVDTKQWALLREVFADDFVFIDAARSLTVNGGDAFVSGVSVRHATSVSIHHGFTPEIEILDASNARGIWAMSDLVMFPRDRVRAVQRGYGHYHEQYVKQNGEWRISWSRLTRLWISIEEERVDLH